MFLVLVGWVAIGLISPKRLGRTCAGLTDIFGFSRRRNNGGAKSIFDIFALLAFGLSFVLLGTLNTPKGGRV